MESTELFNSNTSTYPTTVVIPEGISTLDISPTKARNRISSLLNDRWREIEWGADNEASSLLKSPILAASNSGGTVASNNPGKSPGSRGRAGSVSSLPIIDIRVGDQCSKIDCEAQLRGLLVSDCMTQFLIPLNESNIRGRPPIAGQISTQIPMAYILNNHMYHTFMGSHDPDYHSLLAQLIRHSTDVGTSRFLAATIEKVLGDIKEFNRGVFPVSYHKSFYDGLLRRNCICYLLYPGAFRTGNWVGQRMPTTDEAIIGMASARITYSYPTLVERSSSMDIDGLSTPAHSTSADRDKTVPPKVAYIMTMGVVPQHQGMGLGSYLLEKLVESLFDEGQVEQIELDVLCDNQRAIDLYVRFGFRTQNRIRNYYIIDGVQHDAYHMALTRERYTPKRYRQPSINQTDML